MEDFFRVGIFTSTHGIRGEIKVYPTTDDMHRFSHLKRVYMETKEGRQELTVEHVSYFKNMVIVKFKEYSDINAIERYKGSSLFVAREDAMPLKKGCYYIADLLDSTVMTDDGRRLGILKDVLQTGANDVFVVQGEEKEYLLPNIPSCILEVKPEESRILVHMLDGLEDL